MIYQRLYATKDRNIQILQSYERLELISVSLTCMLYQRLCATKDRKVKVLQSYERLELMM